MKVVIQSEVEDLKTPFDEIKIGQAFWFEDGAHVPSRIRIKMYANFVYAPTFNTAAPYSVYANHRFELVPKGTKIIIEVE